MSKNYTDGRPGRKKHRTAQKDCKIHMEHGETFGRILEKRRETID